MARCTSNWAEKPPCDPSTVDSSVRWNMVKLYHHCLINSESALLFCQRKGLLSFKRICQDCQKPMVVTETSSSDLGYEFICSGVCGNVCSLKTGTLFEKFNFNLRTVIHLYYCFCRDFSSEQTVSECSSDGEIMLDRTVVEVWFEFCRNVCLKAMERKQPQLIGGPSMIVEIDTIRLKKGTEEQWVVGLFCQETKQVGIFALPGIKFDEEKVLQVIRSKVLQDSIVVTKSLPVFESLSEFGYNHLTVNHKRIDPNTGAHIQSITRIWREVKERLPCSWNSPPSVELEPYLAEFLWKRDAHLKNIDSFECFLHELVLHNLSTDTLETTSQ